MMLPMASSKKNIKGEDQGSQEERGKKKERTPDVKRGRKISETMQRTLRV
jgi:hypothetical protein